MKNIAFLYKGTNLLMIKVHLIEEELWIGFYLDYMQKLYDRSSSFTSHILLRSANQN